MKRKILGIGCAAALALMLTLPAAATDDTLMQETLSDGSVISYYQSEEENPSIALFAEQTKLAAPTNIRWHVGYNGDTLMGSLAFDAVENCEGTYSYVLYRNGEPVQSSNWSGLFPTNGKDYVTMNLVEQFVESGTYQVALRARGDGVTYLDSDEVMSPEFVYERPEQQLDLPSNLEWDTEDPTQIKFTLPKNSGGCVITLYYKANEQDEWKPWGGRMWASSIPAQEERPEVEDFSDKLSASGYYRFSIKALSYDITKVAHSEEVMSPVLNFGQVIDKINADLDEQISAVENGTTSADQVKETLQDTPKESLKASMQASEETYDKVGVLEDAYTKEKGISVDTKINNVELNGDVSILGAGLNAADGQKNVTLNIDRPDAEHSLYDPALRSVLEISMKLDGASQAGELDVPVCITMPVPENVNKAALRIFHFRGDGRMDIIWPDFVMVDGQEMIRFAITHFSDFVLADDQGAQKNGWVVENGVEYWYENGVKQGTEGRGKEIYDPESDAWYWLDAVQGGAKTVNKDVYQESEAGQWADRPDGTGKWVRYDANGHMVKGWQTTSAGTYYFDPVFGTMAKGDAVIDGQSHYFDPNTGVMVR